MPVIPSIQKARDFSGTLGAGVDGYTVAYVHANGRFELVEPSSGVTDHGELDGLGDDDHTQYVLLAGRAGGQTIYCDTASGGNGRIDSTAHATKGTLMLNGGQASVGKVTVRANLSQYFAVTDPVMSVFHAAYESQGGAAVWMGTSYVGGYVVICSRGTDVFDHNVILSADCQYSGGLHIGLAYRSYTWPTANSVYIRPLRYTGPYQNGGDAPAFYVGGGASAGENKTGGTTYVIPSVPTGNAPSARIVLQSSVPVASGSSSHSLVDTLVVTEGVLELAQVASGGTPSSNSARIYAKDVAGTAEMHVLDEAGNETQISPHAMDGPASLYDSTDPHPAVLKEVQHYLGGVRYVNVSRTAYLLEELLKAIANGNTMAQIRTVLQNKGAGFIDLYRTESFAQHNARTGSSLTKLDWDIVQEQHQATYDAARAAEIAAHEAWEALPEETRGPEPTVRPEANVKKSKPAWLAARGG